MAGLQAKLDLMSAALQTERARAGVETGERGVLTDAGAAVDLDGGVDDGERGGRCGDFTRGDRAARHFDAVKIEGVRRLEGQEASAVQRDSTFAESLKDAAVLDERRAERDARFRSLARKFQGSLTHADQTHAVM